MQNNRGTSVFRKSYLNDFIVIAIGVFFIAFFIRAWGDMHGDFNEQNVSAISLDAWNLLYYSLRTSMRFLLGMAWSLLFSVVFAVLAARYTPLRRVILPFVNFMESVPLVGFLTFTTVYFLNLYPHSVMGLECTAIFAVFTGQAWNMMLTLYQTLRIVPKELDEAARSFNYNPWQRFWRLEFIYSVPGLLWNAMVSQSAAWFALVASEAIPVGDRSVELPGVGSYIAEALAQQNVPAILYAIVALAANIVLLDQLVFRPLVRYTARFKYEDVTASRPLGNPWFYNSLAFSHVGAALGHTLRALADLWLFKLPRLWYALGLHRLFRLAAKETGCGAACGISAWCWPASGSVTGCGNTSQTVLRHAAGMDAAHHRARGRSHAAQRGDLHAAGGVDRHESAAGEDLPADHPDPGGHSAQHFLPADRRLHRHLSSGSRLVGHPDDHAGHPVVRVV